MKPKEAGKQVAPKLADVSSAVLDTISTYKERFPELKTRNSKLNAKKSAEEVLDELHYIELHYIELQPGSHEDGSVGCQVFVEALGKMEQTSPNYNTRNLQLQGLGQTDHDNIEVDLAYICSCL
ncbi:MAG: hypothetical protein SGPRY_007988 [Prymnesium sp.]